jgi:heterogeneous nuclear ribonucleoprotein U-like protein 1
VFVELNRDESQKYLDQMKQDIPSLSKNNPPTFSWKGSSQYYTGSALQNQGNFTGFYLLTVVLILCFLFNF